MHKSDAEWTIENAVNEALFDEDYKTLTCLNIEESAKGESGKDRIARRVFKALSDGGFLK